MNLVKIPKKKKGEFREICIPTKEEKYKFRKHLAALNEKAGKVCNKDVVHGFSIKRSPVTNAKMHIGFAYTLKFDLSNFFDTVKPSHLKGKLTDDQIIALMPNERAYQGLPTSPVVANIAAIDMDAAILKKIKDKNIVYTRYADDLCFSFNEFENSEFLKKVVPQIVGRCGFILNKSKTWLQDARFGNRIITGVGVSKDGILPTRSVRRKLRAAIHQKNRNAIHGLKEWTKLKEPSNNVDKIDQLKMNELCKGWNIRRIRIHNIPKKISEKLSEDVIISGDPIQILGLSNWSTNWRSCMMHPDGQYHRHAAFWLYLPGTRIAGVLSGSEKTEFGFTRPTFRARTLVHTMQDGKVYYDQIYGESQNAIHTLQNNLELNGIFRVNGDKCPRRNSVVGSVPVKYCIGTPYMDSLRYGSIKKDNQSCYIAYSR
jgi:RNA-directed DNA polymerase